MKPQNFRLNLLAAAIGFATLASAGVATAATTAHHGFAEGVVAQATTLRKGDIMVGPLAQSAPIRIAVSLRLRNPDQLQTFLGAAHSTVGVMARTSMTHDQFRASYSPTTAQANAVVRYLRRAGFTHIKIQPGNTLVTAEGTAAKTGAAFKTSFAQVLTKDGRHAYMNTTKARIPASLENTVLAVVGLQNVHTAHTMSHVSPRAMLNGTATGHYASEFPAIYGADDMAPAAGINVGIVTAGDITQTLADLADFANQEGYDPITAVAVPSAVEGPDDSGVGEWNMDSQAIVGMAGGQVGKLIFYNAASLSNADLAVVQNIIVNDEENAPKVINVSLGMCELYAQLGGTAATDDQTFMQAVAQGQTFSVSSGDDGADQCGNGGNSVSWPASSPYVVSLGGTRVYTTDYTVWADETVWSTDYPQYPGNYGGAGGGNSSFEPKPVWQQGTTPGATRAVPDVSYSADPATGLLVLIDGEREQIGGTSLAAPLFAGAWARVLAAHPDANLGFAAPWLYQLPASSFHDIVSGNNGGQNAAPGYDMASGLGSMMVGAASAAIGGEGGGGGADNGMQNGVAATGVTARTGQDATFKVIVPEGASNLVIEASGGSGNADLYVKAGSAPSLTSYDCRSNRRGNGESCSFATPQAGTYYITLHARRAFANATLKASWDLAGGDEGDGATFSNNTSMPIPDKGYVESSIDVNAGNVFRAVDVRVDISHPYSGDLQIQLTAPDGSVYPLKQANGGDSKQDVHMTYTVFMPSEPFDSNGTWTLRVDDLYTGDHGTLTGWSLELVPEEDEGGEN